MKKYVCLNCGLILLEQDSKPEDQIHCPKCGHDVLFWKKLEEEVKARK